MVDIKSTSNAVWWIKHPKKVERSTTLCQDMTDLFRNISLHGYNKLLETELFLYEKLLWFCLHAANFVIVTSVLSYTWEQFVSQHFSLILHDPLYPIENIPFPAISICSNNRISRQAAENYAYELSRKDPRNRSTDYFLKNIPGFISLYYKLQPDSSYENLEKFQSFLDIYGTNENEIYYDIRQIIKRLSPNCTDLILKCYLNGKEIECFGENAFKEGITMYGPCCTFNSNNSYIQRNSSFRLNTPDLGLAVLLNSSHSDDVVSLLKIDAYVVFIHSPYNFPDISAGSTVEMFAMYNEESFIAVSAKLMDTSDELKRFDTSYRKCYFDGENINRIFSRRYSFANCVLDCRIYSIAALCGCVPFLVPSESLKKLQLPYCSLNHVACLQRYSFKLRNVLTSRVKILGLEREVEEALYCPQCLPACDDTQYDASVMSLPTDRLILHDSMGYDFNIKLEDISILRVYFGVSTAPYYRRVIRNNWEEAFSTVGNIVSIFLGFSMVALFEILYFSLKYLYIAGKMFIINSENNSKLRNTRKSLKIKSKKLYILP